MDFGALRDLALERCHWAHGFDVVITRPAPNDSPISCRGLWLTQTTDNQPLGASFTRPINRHVMMLDRLDVEEVPQYTLIVAPERMGHRTFTWIVDGHEETQADQHRVILRKIDEAS